MDKKSIEKIMEGLIDTLYEEFKGTPSAQPIVRNNQKNDAFTLAVLKVLYGKKLNLLFKKDNSTEIAGYVVAPPDSGIDIFVTRENGDETQFDVIQVKYAKESRISINSAFSYMKKTINDFCKSPKNIRSESCKAILNRSGLEKGNKKNCQYYVIHTGDIHGKITDADDETVLNLIDLDIIVNSLKYKVTKERFSVGTEKNALLLGDEKSKQNAIEFNLNCYELARLNLKYYSTDAGRNILFGYNLREMLKPKQSRSFIAMKRTLNEEPTNFWYYNNGITIVAEDAVWGEEDDNKYLDVSLFSIVNGAQTTSALGWILNEANNNHDECLIEKMKQAYVIARVLKVTDEIVQHNIAIFNNTQNPINSRDMVANNAEQRMLHDILLDDTYPQIYMENRRGAERPQTFNKLYSHRDTTNEALAQLAFAGFYLDPGTAKDKKSALFNNMDDPDYILNEFYHKIFSYDPSGEKENGILFRKTKNEIDELLFSAQLYKECKGHLRKSYQALIDQYENQKVTASSAEKDNIDIMISMYSRTMDTIGICMVYFVAAYANMGSQFGSLYKNKRYDYEKYYGDKKYRADFVKEAADLFLMETVNILISTAVDNHKESNMNNWVRGKLCPTLFIPGINKAIALNPFAFQKRYESFMEKYKIIPI